MTRVALITPDGALDYLLPELRRALPDGQLVEWPAPEARDAEVAICWRPPAGVLAAMPRLRMMHGIAAGVDNILRTPDLPDAPLCRIVDEGLEAAMAEYVQWGVLYFHRFFDQAIANGRNGVWACPEQPAACDISVGIMGLGAMGMACARRLVAQGYRVSAWTRTPRMLPDIRIFAGWDGLDAFLAQTGILVCLLPLTPDTVGILNAARLARLPKGASLILASRGAHLAPGDLVALLREGHLRGAVLDVFEGEPLAPEHPLWREPGVLVTPHMAGSATPRDIAIQIAENIRRLDAGEPLLNVVDRSRGY